MTRTSRIRYVLSKPVCGPLFRGLGTRALRSRAPELSQADAAAFVQALWVARYGQVRVDPWEFVEEFGRRKLEMVYRMVQHASRRTGLAWQDVVHQGRFEVKYQVRDRFTPGESTDAAREKWSPDDVMFWNIVAGLKWERTVFQPQRLAGVPLLDYGCNVGALSWLARTFGATSLTLVDVPGAALDFAGSLFEGDVAVLPVLTDGPPPGLATRKVGIAYCYHVLEHVPDPMAVVRAIHQSLMPRGVFSVTYASMPETEGGCNLRVAQDVRPEVLAFMRSAFKVLEWNESRVEYLLEKR